LLTHLVVFIVVVNIQQGFGTNQKKLQLSVEDAKWNKKYLGKASSEVLNEAKLKICPDLLLARQCRKQ